ncbi:SURF4 family protein [Clavispora lusitaniae]|uniref:ER-derived vesicles protein n=2 Tax=Clavispora lusitaniae TaxID=36911 RepID=C4YA82_CLAL4|nr:uncharacterized protein CLUG_05020 [Clavispora lusitaniae ATCC 42720]EEQ40892.1 hypothetical protein CLUG_05020 [Clavispora lusitaniae ATCC 42720]KAF7580900.1 SURF4 family protein [Clavispora lusitaniae]OVF10075.1 putative ER-derived vesicles protein [Clavispora lusitaniae]
MSYRGPNQFNNQFNSPLGREPSARMGPISSQPGGFAKVESFTKKAEDFLDEYFSPLKPYVPAIGRLFIVATFYEDALRIFSQWTDQVYYLHVYRRFWKWLTVVFLFVNVLMMLVASTLLVLRRYSTFSTVTLCLVVFFQGVFYGLIFDSEFLLRNLSVMGGLILAYSDTLVREKRSLPGLPMLGGQDNKKYFLLAGRLLLIFLFLGFVFSANWSFARVVVILIGLVACTSIVVGYKTKFAAAVLTVLLFTYNVFVNQFWKYSAFNANRDFLKYEFFQTMSIVGGLLIIVNAGAGALSIDEKKKIY